MSEGAVVVEGYEMIDEGVYLIFENSIYIYIYIIIIILLI
jgi:hypothetical protein